jgi:uncharacterized protein (TIGR03067 family)
MRMSATPMKKYIICVCFIVFVSFAAVAADMPDAKAIQGDWKPVKAELAGQPMPDEVLKTIALNIGEGTYEVHVGNSPDKGTVTVDSSTTPKSMTITGTEGPNKGKTFPCIYEIKGDTLRICYDLSGAKRPAEFKTIAGTKLYLVTYTRK